MKFITVFALILALLTVKLASPAPALAANAPPDIHGEAAYLMDLQSGMVIYAKNPDEELAPASTTKIMTALLALELGNLNDIVTASKTMLNNQIVYGTQIYLTPGEQMPLRDLLYAVLLNSANDAAVDVAEHIGGNLQNFVDLMNARAKQIGMLNTHFANPTGLTQDGHYTTAHDLALLARVAYQNPVFRAYVNTKTYTIPRQEARVPTEMVNENKLLWQDPDVNGMKTGYTSAAGNCLVATATRGGRQLVGVILKSPGGEMYGDMQTLLNYGFSASSTTTYKGAGSVVARTEIGNQSVNLVLAAPIYLTQTAGEPAPVLHFALTDTKAGLKTVGKGDILAQLEVREGNALVDTVNLLADRSVQPPSSHTTFALPAGLVYAASAGGALLLFALYFSVRRSQCLRPKRRATRRRRESHP